MWTIWQIFSSPVGVNMPKMLDYESYVGSKLLDEKCACSNHMSVQSSLS